ncbi:MAG: [FeFe] hydrogenase H-cluster maturation GTPase HydF [Eubacteriales bacterium]|nr:[FeFe] hydrogenase H-cluster maturation GTPase HydF [Eubacteriales bacterium]
MSMNDTPSGERIHIGFFGRRNAGKSSIVNAVSGQQLSVVSSVKGTTTDPVYKSMELLSLGPVVIIDTPGFDDEGALGTLRVRRTRQILNKADCAVLVVDAALGKTEADEEMIQLFRQRKLPYLVVYNKLDLLSKDSAEASEEHAGQPGGPEPSILVSAKAGLNILQLKERIAALLPSGGPSRPLVRDLLHPGDFVMLVIPIDDSAPKGRLILPQQQMIRDILEAGAVSIAVRDTELAAALKSLKDRSGIRPAMVITDSQAFGPVSTIVPESIPLTSFSILMARYKGFLEPAVRGVRAIEDLRDGDRILISEGCSHHRQCEDIGTVKIPAWLLKHTGKSLRFEATSGRDFPEDLSPYRLIIHCGGCMLNSRELLYRQKCAEDAKIPFTNYGITIAYLKGILKRSLAPFPGLQGMLSNH